ncbi:MAG: gliding motility protein GldN [Vicingaceae bacterium]
MNVKKVLIIGVLAVILSPIAGVAQNKILDGVYIKENTPTRRVIPYTQVREADVMWSKRIWRTLPLREKINHPLFYPIDEIDNRKSLFQVLLAGIDEGTITAYGDAAFDDEFKRPMTKTEALGMLSEYATIYREDDFGNMVLDSVPDPITADEIKWYWVKEDWIFDRERSVLDVRIIGLCPVQEKLNDDGTVRGPRPLFWVYFPEARYVFANYDVFNTFNDAERRTYEDVFWKRTFSSFVRKESNVFERYIADYKTGIDVLLESERIKTQIFNYEHDLWHY